MDKKGMGMFGWGVIVTMSLAVIVIIVGGVATNSWTSMIFSTIEDTKCGTGTTPGIEGNLPTACSWYECGKSEEAGSTPIGGCPSNSLRNKLQEKEVEGGFIDEYKNCCSVKKCSGIEDKISEESDPYPRKSACFSEGCDKDNKEAGEVDKEKCISYSKNCKEKDGCCCIINPNIGEGKESPEFTGDEETEEEETEEKGSCDNEIEDIGETDVDCGGQYCEDCECVLYDDKFHYYGDSPYDGSDYLIYKYSLTDHEWKYIQPRHPNDEKELNSLESYYGRYNEIGRKLEHKDKRGGKRVFRDFCEGKHITSKR